MSEAESESLEPEELDSGPSVLSITLPVSLLTLFSDLSQLANFEAGS
jgi:hypothetical protein